MSRRRQEPTRLDLPDGYYWLRTWINLRGGGHVGEWKLARVVGGSVQVLGPDAELGLECPYLEQARWVRIDPPDAETPAVRQSADGRRRCDPGCEDAGGEGATRSRVRLVAEGIVDAFLAVHQSAASYYARRPEHLEELTDRIARLIERVRG